MTRKYQVMFRITVTDDSEVTFDTFRKVLEGTDATIDETYGLVKKRLRKGVWIARGTASEEALAEIRNRDVVITPEVEIGPAQTGGRQ